MNILVNASNIKKGGGIQVADSICRELKNFPQHEFLVVHTKALDGCVREIKKYANVVTVMYEIPINLTSTLSGRDRTLNELVKEYMIDAVLTIFGPSRWKPQVPHLSGFAKSQLVLPESPFWKILPIKQKIIYCIKNGMTKYSFGKCADNYYTENPFISQRLQALFPKKRVFTVTNNANQVFLHPEQWDKSTVLPPFNGVSLLTVSANYPHKNLPIIVKTCHYLEEKYHGFEFRFVLTIRENELPQTDECTKRHVLFIGPVSIAQVPHLYNQCDVMLLPTLLECFSASYAEAMVMKKPILTTNLNFARGLCGNAAMYYDAISPDSLGDCIYRMASDKELCKELVMEGVKQLQKFDTFEQRAEKLVALTERITKE